MKKIVGLILVTTSLTACSDGDLVFENLNFDGIQIQKCEDNELYFKTKDNELLLVDFSDNRNGTKGSILDTSVPGGKVFYTRTITPAVSENGVSVNYMYTINFENITLTNGTSDIKYATLPYGSYVYDTSKITFNFNNNYTNCDNVLVGRTA